MKARPTPAPYPVPPLTSRQFAALRDQLEEQRRFRLDQLHELRSTDPGNAGEVTEMLAAGARAALRDVLVALLRMDAGTYGSCAECGTQLPIERLEVLPQVTECLACRREAVGLDRG